MNTYNETADIKYYIKLFEYNHTTKTIDYAGLYSEKGWNTEEEAREEFGYATEGDKGYIAVELIIVFTDGRENVIEEWKDNIDDYIEEEEENA